jgi:stearoyl-CoA desaturase (delta-9 desaturase)
MSMLHVEDLRNPDLHPKPKRLVIETPYLHRMQFRHFMLFNVVPFIGAGAAVAFAFVHPVSRVDVILFLSMWLLTGLGVSIGYHRLFTHRSFETSTSMRVALAILGSMAGLGPVISWSAMHRRHHQCADHEGDMHSPNLHGESLGARIRGLIHAHISWMVKHEYPNIVYYTPDLLEDRALVRTSRHYDLWVLLGLTIPAVIAGLVSHSLLGALSGFLWGGLVRMFVVSQSISTLNSVLHSAGAHPFALHDNSRNSWFLALMIWGEGWHHNHHAFPRSASFGLAWYRIDFSYWVILLLQRLGLVWNVKVPSQEQIAARLKLTKTASPPSPAHS